MSDQKVEECSTNDHEQKTTRQKYLKQKEFYKKNDDEGIKSRHVVVILCHFSIIVKNKWN